MTTLSKTLRTADGCDIIMSMITTKGCKSKHQGNLSIIDICGSENELNMYHHYPPGEWCFSAPVRDLFFILRILIKTCLKKKN